MSGPCGRARGAASRRRASSWSLRWAQSQVRVRSCWIPPFRIRHKVPIFRGAGIRMNHSARAHPSSGSAMIRCVR
eukprot:4489436-Prymnesium_polylepis.1